MDLIFGHFFLLVALRATRMGMADFIRFIEKFLRKLNLKRIKLISIRLRMMIWKILLNFLGLVIPIAL